MTLLLVQKDGVILLLFFTDLQVEDLKECFEIAVDSVLNWCSQCYSNCNCIELVHFSVTVTATVLNWYSQCYSNCNACTAVELLAY
jgi:hypothetical protein